MVLGMWMRGACGGIGWQSHLTAVTVFSMNNGRVSSSSHLHPSAQKSRLSNDIIPDEVDHPHHAAGSQLLQPC